MPEIKIRFNQSKKSKAKMKCTCDQCGNPMPLDTENSADGWEVYNNACPCGGSIKFELADEE
jgi:hypothetical protein